jgi:antitoxin component YwqK of YwqJK toxin-antitoxin module
MRTIFLLLLIVLSTTATTSCSRKKAVPDERRVLHAEGDINVDGDIVHWQAYAERDSFFKSFTLDKKMNAMILAKSQAEMNDSTFTRRDYSPGGKLVAVKSWRSGVPHGEWFSYHANGMPASHSVLDNGMLLSYSAWYASGKTQVEGKRNADGTMARTEYFENGNPGQEFQTDTLGNGTGKYWWRNGRPREEGGLLRFSPQGRWKRYDTLGQPLPDTIYGTHDIR